MDPKRLAGPLKAAILIKSLDQQIARSLLNQMNEMEREKISKLIPQVSSVSVELVEKIAKEFSEKARDGTDQPQAKRLKASPKPQPLGKTESSRFGRLETLDSDHLVQIIKEEHPQVLAVLLSNLDFQKAGDILNRFPEELRTDVALRIGNLERIPSELVDELVGYFEEVLKNEAVISTQTAGGVSFLAKVLNKLGGETGEKLIEQIKANNSNMAEAIEINRFVFEDIVLVDDKGLQSLLRNVETQDLAVSLKAASEEVKDKILRNLSKRASQMLKEEIESLGAVRMKDVTDAQQKISRIVKEMQGKGELIIAGSGTDEFVG
jgi:flagellar motor switch protein FliG